MSETRIDTTGSQTVSVAEASQILGVSKGLLYERAKQDKQLAPGLPFLKIGSSLRLPRERLLAFARGDWTGES